MHRRRFVLAAFAAVLTLAGCARDSSTPGAATSPTSTAPEVTGDGIVFAAASLTESFKTMSDAFEKEHPGTNLTFNFAASSALAAQIVEGKGVADVFASADDTNMKKVVDAALVDGSPVTLAKNRLQIAVAPGNPKKVVGLADLAKPGLKVVLAAPQVPAGKYAAEAFTKAGVTVKPVSLEADVKSVLSKVVLGEADAGVVYSTDVKAAGNKVQGVEIPGAQNVVASYPIARIRGSRNAAVAKAFVEYARSEPGQKVLRAHGFLAP